MSDQLRLAASRALEKEEAVRRREERLQEKKRREAPSAVPPAVAPPKHTKRLITKEARQKKLREGAEKLEAEKVRKLDGSEVLISIARADIIAFLRGRQHFAEASLDELCDATGIPLLRNPTLHASLRENQNPRVEWLETSGGPRLRYRPEYGVRNKAQLEHLLRLASPRRADGGPQTVSRAKLLESSYVGIERDIQALVEQKVAVELASTSDGSADRKVLLFCSPEYANVSEVTYNMWQESRVPKGDDLQRLLVNRKLLTQQELNDREDRKIAARKATLAEIAKNKKSRAPTFRKVTNSHLVK
ncbi:hypothetical protein AB1Y20_007461 [Prymnesium parvum]|uniref:TFIIE beta domain-containing protein n=1 Tax=Prymnesium parvum TaxID=97485 RepID=A0AB34IX46_PRYPA